MARIKVEKEYNEKKRRILECTIELLSEIGYEAFSINKVIEKCSISKGAFFHYFGSKIDLLKGLLDIYFAPMVEAFESIVDDMKMSPKEKIIALFLVMVGPKNKEDRSFQQLTHLLQRQENLSIRTQVQAHYKKECLPIYERVIIEGNQKGDFQIANPNGSAFMHLTMIIAINNEIGLVLLKEKVDPKAYEGLKDKIMVFESYSKELFGFDNDVNFYNEKILNVSMK